MDKIKIGIPRALHYYYYKDLWKTFLEELGCTIIISPETTNETLERGKKIANDEMCLSLKIYLGHVSYLESRCDYILVPRIDNYGTYEQTCTNFLGLFDIVSNLFTNKLLTYNIDEAHHQTEQNAFIKLGLALGKGKEQSILAYQNSKQKEEKQRKQKRKNEMKKLESNNPKLLIISHPYNLEDPYIGKTIKEILKNLQVEYINGEYLIDHKTIQNSTKLSPNLYWKYNKELIGTIEEWKQKIDGILFLTTFPCGPDSLVNELMIRKIKIPHLNLIIDEESGSAGIETRLESFIDILGQTTK